MNNPTANRIARNAVDAPAAPRMVKHNREIDTPIRVIKRCFDMVYRAFANAHTDPEAGRWVSLGDAGHDFGNVGLHTFEYRMSFEHDGNRTGDKFLCFTVCESGTITVMIKNADGSGVYGCTWTTLTADELGKMLAANYFAA